MVDFEKLRHEDTSRVVMTTVAADGARLSLLQLPLTLDGKLDLYVYADNQEVSRHHGKAEASRAFHREVQRRGGPRRGGGPT